MPEQLDASDALFGSDLTSVIEGTWDQLSEECQEECDYTMSDGWADQLCRALREGGTSGDAQRAASSFLQSVDDPDDGVEIATRLMETRCPEDVAVADLSTDRRLVSSSLDAPTASA